jgi:hypothetical protein
MATFIDTVNAGAYYLNWIPFHGGGGGGGGVGVPLFAVHTNTIQQTGTGAVSTIPAGNQQYFVIGSSTAPSSGANKLSMLHGFDNSNGALASSASALRFTTQLEGFYTFSMSVAGAGATPASYSGQLASMILVNAKAVAQSTRRAVGTDTPYSERSSITADVYLQPNDLVSFVLAWDDASTGFVIDRIVLTGTLLNHPPS